MAAYNYLSDQRQFGIIFIKLNQILRSSVFGKMGQVLGRLQRKEWRRKQVKKIAEEVFKRFKTQSGHPNLTFEDLYIAVLGIYNEINKHSPGPHFDPPSKEQVRVMMEECDMNLDGELDHEEFSKFIERLTVDTLCVLSRGLILALVVAPSIALATKKTTEGVPFGIGKAVQRLPTSVYASLVALAVVYAPQIWGK
ncbi:hypothetical protein V2J09_017421 [Rumex salicifolius]